MDVTRKLNASMHHSTRRLCAGLVFEPVAATLQSALVEFEHSSLGIKAKCLAGTTTEVAAPPSMIEGDKAVDEAVLANWHCRHLAEAAARALQQCIRKVGLRTLDNLLAIGLRELPDASHQELPAFCRHSLSPALLAEFTGLNVIDAFSEKDLAGGGSGEPLDAVPLWTLLRDGRRHRFCVCLNSPRFVAFLPAGFELSHNTGIAAACLPDVRGETIARHLRQIVPPIPNSPEGIVIGSAEESERITGQLSGLLPGVQFAKLADYALESSWCVAVSAALLAHLQIAGLPASFPSTTRVVAPRVLGRLTPGSPQHWRRMLETVLANSPQRVPLRQAVA